MRAERRRFLELEAFGAALAGEPEARGLCSRCFGEGKEPCARCHGTDREPCTACPVEGPSRCTLCFGLGYTSCPERGCQRGYIDKRCTLCKGDGVAALAIAAHPADAWTIATIHETQASLHRRDDAEGDEEIDDG